MSFESRPEATSGPALAGPGKPEANGNPVPRLALRLTEVAECLGVSKRVIQRERAAGRFPRPDLFI
jgi:hypothetical protein